MKQQSFILYHDMWEQLKELTDAERWKILEAMFIYHSTWEIIAMDRLLSIVFSGVRTMLDRDRDKYQEYVEKQSENGSKGWRPKKTQPFSEETQKTQPFFWKPKKADSASLSPNPNPNPSDSVSDRIIISSEIIEQKTEYQENIDYMKVQADNIRKNNIPDTPDFVQNENEWIKFLLYWTAPTKSWKILCEETKQKSFDIRRRFVTWIWNNNTQPYSQNKKPTIWKLLK